VGFLDFSIFLSIQWDYDAVLLAPPNCLARDHATKNTSLNLRHSDVFATFVRMDDDSEIFNEANSILQTLLSAQAEEVTRLLATTVKGETGRPPCFVAH